MTPFGVPSAPGSQEWIAQFAAGPPPALTSERYARDYNELRRVGNVSSGLTERPQNRADVARFYDVSSPTFVFNLALRQVAAAEGSSLSENARALALLNMASNDSLVASFWTKYHYELWRPETAIVEGNLDGNAKTDADPTFVPYILTPCFPSYPSNHGSGSNSAAEILRRVYGAGGHAITMANPAVPGLTFHYTTFHQITDDISDARVFGGIHFRFDQEAGADLGRDIAAYVYKHNLRRAKHSDRDDDQDDEPDEPLGPSQVRSPVPGTPGLFQANNTLGMLAAGARGAAHVRGKDRVHPEHSFVTSSRDMNSFLARDSGRRAPTARAQGARPGEELR